MPDSAGDALDGGAADAGSSALPLRKRQQKVPLNTYVRPGTQQRVEVLKDRGYAVTDIVDAALNEFLDRAGVPQAEFIGPLEPGQRFPPDFLALATTHRFATIEAEEVRSPSPHEAGLLTVVART